MIRIGPSPICWPALFRARNFWTIGRTLPGLQNMMSRTRNIGPPVVWAFILAYTDEGCENKLAVDRRLPADFRGPASVHGLGGVRGDFERRAVVIEEPAVGVDAMVGHE